MVEAYQNNLHEILDNCHFQLSDILPSEWTEQNRYMDSSVSRYRGKFSYDITPYSREIVDTLSPDHPARIVSVMKGAQIGFSTGVIEPGIGWIISQNPGNILLLTGHSDLSEEAIRKVDHMIDTCGIRGLIRPNVQRRRSMKTGDTNMKKEFPGGSLVAGSAGNHKLLRQRSVRYGFIDDFDAAKKSTRESGDTRKMIEQRFAAYGDNMKLFYISTPELKHLSNIEPVYLAGDRRRYFVPCPKCGEYITIEWKVDKGKERAGIVWKLDKQGSLIRKSVGYVCQQCGSFFKDTHKYEMNLAGEWKPTAKPEKSSNYSFHISSLYAPPGMYDWEHYVYQYLEACPPGQTLKYELYKTFVNVVLGETWEERGTSPKVNRLSQNTRTYEVGSVPDSLSQEDQNGHIIMVTVSADLNGTEDDARLDYEIVAWSESGASYSIDHGSVGTFIPRENTKKVKVDRERWSYIPYAERNVWDTFMEVLKQPLFSEDGQSEYKIMIFGLDTGNHTQYAYDFVSRCKSEDVFCVGLKGQNANAYRKNDANTRTYSKSRERSDLYMVQVNQIKDELAGKVNLRWVEQDGTKQPYGFMNFPSPSAGKYTMKDYFIQYESEHKILKNDPQGKEVGYIWEKKNSNALNTFWDCRVYNEAVKDILMDAVCKELGIKDPSWRAYCNAVLGVK